jgi:hypothetical protein
MVRHPVGYLKQSLDTTMNRPNTFWKQTARDRKPHYGKGGTPPPPIYTKPEPKKQK